jgi:hypothetical protein
VTDATREQTDRLEMKKEFDYVRMKFMLFDNWALWSVTQFIECGRIFDRVNLHWLRENAK